MILDGRSSLLASSEAETLYYRKWGAIESCRRELRVCTGILQIPFATLLAVKSESLIDSNARGSVISEEVIR